MIKFTKSTILLLAFTIAVCSAEPQRYRTAKIQQRRIFARQEIAPTPYPSAAELKPEAAFEETAAGQQQPDQTYGPPDQTYGPPEQDVIPNVEQLPAADAPEDFEPSPPNPDAEELDVPVEEPEQDISSRLISRRRGGAPPVRSQRLTTRLRAVNTQKKRRVVQQRLIAAAPPASAVPLPFLTAPQQYVVLNSPFSYTAQYQSW